MVADFRGLDHRRTIWVLQYLPSEPHDGHQRALVAIEEGIIYQGEVVVGSGNTSPSLAHLDGPAEVLDERRVSIITSTR